MYGQSYRETMDMPMRAFWAFSGYADRVLTAESIDHLQIVVAGQTPEGATDAMKRMALVAPNPVKYTAATVMAATAVRDEEGFNALRSLAG